MEQKFQAFILTAETLNMSRAAERSCVSPQCISGHIRNLEREYGVRLFERRPNLKLTPEGSKLLEVLYEMRRMETSISGFLNGHHSSIIGRVSLGIPSSRYSVLVPEILEVFKKEYPNVELQILEDFSASLAWQVERGTLDMAITAQQEPSSSLKTAFCIPEIFYFLVPRTLLHKQYGSEFPGILKRLEAGITLEECFQFPLILYPPTSRLRNAMEQYGKRLGMGLTCAFETNHMELMGYFSCTLTAGSFVSDQVFFSSRNAVSALVSGENLCAFPVCMSPLEIPLNISLVYHKSAYLSEYKKALIQMISDRLTVETALE